MSGGNSLQNGIYRWKSARYSGKKIRKKRLWRVPEARKKFRIQSAKLKLSGYPSATISKIVFRVEICCTTTHVASVYYQSFFPQRHSRLCCVPFVVSTGLQPPGGCNKTTFQLRRSPISDCRATPVWLFQIAVTLHDCCNNEAY